MKIINYKTHPIFESDQVLTSGHLNDMFNYLEEQERIARVKLIGSGIVCGLNASIGADGKSVEITKGVAITSKGYLAVLENEYDIQTGEIIEGEINSYKFYKPFSNAGNLDDAILSNDIKYSFFDGKEIFELYAQDVDGSKTFENLSKEKDGLSLEDYGVVLFAECFDKELKNCIENDCNEKGIEREFTLRKLLVSKSDLETLIRMEDETIGNLEEEINAKYYLQPFHIPRLKIINSVTTTQQLSIIYEKLIYSAIRPILENISAGIKFLKPILKGEVDQSKIDAFDPNFLNKIIAEFKNTNLCYYQYVYDALCDLTDTYNELVEVAFDMISECCPSISRFPKHIRLGHLTNTESCIPSKYRTRFTQSPIYNSGHQRREQIIALFKKLYELSQNFNIPLEYQTVRVTPSVALAQPLSEKSIPYYYNIEKELLRNWNPNLKRKCRELENLSYHATSYANKNLGTPQNHILNPLDYALSNYDFFRIEGHICKDYRQSLREIINIRDANNLPFDVIALKLSDDATDTSFDKATCNFKDLEILYEAWKSELQCLLGKVVKKLSGIKLKDSFRNPLEEAEDKAASETPAVPVADSKTIKVDAKITRADSSFLSTSSSLANSLGFTTNLASNKFTLQRVYEPRVLASVIDKIDSSDDVLGNALKKAISVEPEICKYDIKGTQVLQDQLASFPEYAGLTLIDHNVGFQFPLELSVGVLDFSNAMDKNYNDLDLNEIEKKLLEMNRRATVYIAALNSYEKYGDRKLNIDFEALTRISRLLLTNCSFETLKELKREMELRKAEILKMNLFSEYLKKNPGIDHKAGVPKGGTFILVYSDEVEASVEDNTGTPNNVVSGLVTDKGGNLLAGGANIMVKGTNTKTTLDSKGAFSLNIPTGKQIITVSSLGLPLREFEVQGGNNIIIKLGNNKLPIESGTVVADFFLPYLCCSDCPPVAYVLPEKKEITPAENVSLTITKKVFCSGDKPHVFIVTPADGKVTGKGVTGDATGGYFFNPKKVRLGDDFSKKYSFQVNDKDVSLQVTVEKTPKTDFTPKLEWRKIDPLKPGEALFLDLKISSYEPKFKYYWSVFLKSNGSQIFDEEHNGNPGAPEVQTIELKGRKPTEQLLIKLVAVNSKCRSFFEKVLTVPDQKNEIPLAFELTNKATKNKIPSPFVFSKDDQNTYLISAKPAGNFEGINNGTLILKLEETISSEETIYSFSPGRKLIGDYKFIYNTKDLLQTGTLIISIEDKSKNLIGPLTDLKSLSKNANLTEILGKNSKGINNTVNVSNVLNKRISNPTLTGTVAKGDFNKNFVDTFLPAMNEVSSKITSVSKPNQKVLLEFYEKQIATLLNMIAVQSKDVNAQSELSKMATQVNTQLVKLKSSGVKINVSKRLEKSITKVGKELQGKPKAKGIFEKLLKTVKEK